MLQVSFDLTTRREDENSLVRSATATESNIDAVLALTPEKVADELHCIDVARRRDKYVDMHYEMFLYCLVNRDAFDALMEKRGIEGKARERLFRRYAVNANLILSAYEQTMQ